MKVLLFLFLSIGAAFSVKAFGVGLNLNNQESVQANEICNINGVDNTFCTEKPRREIRIVCDDSWQNPGKGILRLSVDGKIYDIESYGVSKGICDGIALDANLILTKE